MQRCMPIRAISKNRLPLGLSLRLLWAEFWFGASQQRRWRRIARADTPVAPIEEMLMRWAGGSIWRGGPQVEAGKPCAALDHFRGSEAVGDPTHNRNWAHWPRRQERLFWCGPLCDHFGHQLGEFGGRVLLSSLDRQAGWLLFLHPNPAASWDSLKPWQRDWIEYLNPTGKPVLISGGGFKASRLVAIPQQQRLGALPTQRHLAALGQRSRVLDGPAIEPVVVLSRSRHAAAESEVSLRGSFAGEAAFDARMAACGARIVYPETLPLRALLELLHRAQRLVVAEGSVLHALELLGYDANKQVVVLARRPLWPGQERPLRCRFPQLRWIDAVEELLWHEPSNPRVKGLARLNWSQALQELDAALGWSSRPRDAMALDRASQEQLNKLHQGVELKRLHCGPEQRIPLSSGGW